MSGREVLHAAVITGSRTWPDERAGEIHAVIDSFPKNTLFIHGACRSGADRIADDYCRRTSRPVVPMAAQWELYGKEAGPYRNRHMCEVLVRLELCGYRVSVEAFSVPGSRGTKNCKYEAYDHAIRVTEHGEVGASTIRECRR